MFSARIGFAFLCGAAALMAQAPRVNPEAAPATPDEIIAAMSAREEYRPDVSIMTTIVRSLRPVAKVSDAVKAETDKLSAEAQPFLQSGNTGEARRRLAQAVCLLLGRAWNAREEYGASLALRTDMTVADLSRPWVAQLAQRYPIRAEAASGLRLRVSLAEGGLPGRADVVVSTGKIIKEMGTFDLASRDLNDDPYKFDFIPAGVPEGAYMVVAEVLDGSAPITHLVTPVYFVRDLALRQAAIEKALARIQGHESAKATILYPFDLARGINASRREVNRFDWPTEVSRSESVLKSLVAGKDPLYQAKGDNRRNYSFTEAGEIMPYRIFVPSKWDGKTKMPIVLALHGSQLDENNMLTRNDNEMQKLAEQHGYLVAAPLGYRINGGYGRIGNPAPPPGSAPGTPASPIQARISDLSEMDAMNVLDVVTREYNADPSRTYVMGNSMGGGGTWTLAIKHPEKFAAIAPCASPARNLDAYSFGQLKGMPTMHVHGDSDELIPVAGARATEKAMKEQGMPLYTYVEVKGGMHGTAVQIVMPQIFDFFAKYQKK